MTAQLISLEDWAASVYGGKAPSLYTLRRWARDGNIQPKPEKHGRTYFVVSGASYKANPYGRRSRLLDRVNVTAPKKCA